MLGLFGFLLLLFPVLNFFRITTLMNDRYLYLPSIIVFAIAASAVSRILKIAESGASQLVRTAGNGVRGTVAIASIAACLTLTQQHLPVWRDSYSLWTRAIQRYPKMPVLRIQMALTIHARGQEREAIRQLQLALLECQPDELDRERMRGMIAEWQIQINDRRNVAISRR